MITLGSDLANRLRLAAAQFEGVDLSRDGSALRRELDGVCGSLQERYQGKGWLEIPGVAETRALYKAIGLDPETVERIARLTGAQPVGPTGSVERR